MTMVDVAAVVAIMAVVAVGRQTCCGRRGYCRCHCSDNHHSCCSCGGRRSRRSHCVAVGAIAVAPSVVVIAAGVDRCRGRYERCDCRACCSRRGCRICQKRVIPVLAITTVVAAIVDATMYLALVAVVAVVTVTGIAIVAII